MASTPETEKRLMYYNWPEFIWKCKRSSDVHLSSENMLSDGSWLLGQRMWSWSTPTTLMSPSQSIDENLATNLSTPDLPDSQLNAANCSSFVAFAFGEIRMIAWIRNCKPPWFHFKERQRFHAAATRSIVHHIIAITYVISYPSFLSIYSDRLL